ncbi:MAG: B12-binding domain-containing radical SAM protein [Deltaproteobacteria bacterium]|nr:B12-binding domain-containing radical SAM protein [Deltaproteobacteria bacterium]
MRVLLVHSKFPATYWGFQYSLPIIGKRATLPPLGLCTLAALLPTQWSLRLVDLNVGTLTDAELRWADVVFVGGMLVQADSMREVVARARALGRPTVVGGPAPTTSPHLFPEADALFLGEAEGRVDELVTAVEELRKPRRRLTPMTLARPEHEARPQLSHSAVPRYDLLDVASYRTLSVQYSRGCPFTCEFCDVIEIFGRVPRVKSDEQVLAELDAIYRLGHRGPVFFVDDNFIGNKKAVRKLLPVLREWQHAHGNPFQFYTEASVNLAADEPLVRDMVAAGFNSVFIGIETASVEALRETRKKQNVGVDLTAAVESLTRAGLEVMGGFIVGFDSDGPEAFEAQRAFIASVPIPLAMVGMLIALPGTQLEKRLTREDRLRFVSSGDQFSRTNFEPKMGDQALLEGYIRLLDELYSLDAYEARCARFLELIGPPAKTAPTTLVDLEIVARAAVRLGVLGERRALFWRLLARAARGGLPSIRWAITHAVQGEHMIRYTHEVVLPRLRRAASRPSRGSVGASTSSSAASRATPSVVGALLHAGGERLSTV